MTGTDGIRTGKGRSLSYWDRGRLVLEKQKSRPGGRRRPIHRVLSQGVFYGCRLTNRKLTTGVSESTARSNHLGSRRKRGPLRPTTVKRPKKRGSLS